MLTHWGRVTHICVSKLTIISSDNGLWPTRRQAGILLIRPLETNFSGILVNIDAFSFKKMHFKTLPAKWRPFLYWPQCVDDRRQAIIWTNVAILSIRPQGTYFSEILFETQKCSFKEMHWIYRLRNGCHFVSASMRWDKTVSYDDWAGRFSFRWWLRG